MTARHRPAQLVVQLGKRLLSRATVTAALLGSPLAVEPGLAQTTVSVLADGYFSHNFNQPPSDRNRFRAFDIHDDKFRVNLAKLTVERDVTGFGFRADVGAGDTMKFVHLPEADRHQLYRYVQQAYVSAGHQRFRVDFGKFVSRHGNEVMEGPDNWNYTRSLLYTSANPQYHVGGRATLIASDSLSFTGLVVNGWNHSRNDLRGKTAGFGGAYQAGRFGFEQNYLFGKEQLASDAMRHLFDSVATYEVSPRLQLAANYDYGMDRLQSSRVRWQGVAMSADVAALDWLNVSPRLEWFDDPQGFRTGTAQTLREVTLTSRFAVHQGVTFSAEYRHDWSNRASFEARDGSMRDSQNTVAFGLSYTWSPRREAPPARTEDTRPTQVPAPARPALTFTADPATITRGQSTTLRWEARDATSLTIEPGIGAVGVSGSRPVTPDASVTYTATAIGPGGRTTESVRVTVDVPVPVAAPPPDRTPSLDELFRQNVVDILFDFDKSDIRTDQTARLRANARWLRDNPTVRFTIEGHADERGTQEYNIGLGDRRATAVREFLLSEGIAADRMRTISYGEERPLCTEQNEVCWQRNRRGSSALNP